MNDQLIVRQPSVVKSLLFALSNILADCSRHVDQALCLGVGSKLHQLWNSLETVATDDAQSLKIEIVMCIGNMTVGVKDALLVTALALLTELMHQGGLDVLTAALNPQYNNGQCVKSALESLQAVFGLFKKARCEPNMAKTEAQKEHGASYMALLLDFESRLGGVDALERCQYHHD